MHAPSDQADASTTTPASSGNLADTTHPASYPACVATRREQLELVAGLAYAYGECEDLGGFDGEHEVRICENSLIVFIIEVKITVACLGCQAYIPLGRPQRG